MQAFTPIEGPSVWRGPDFSGKEDLRMEFGRHELNAIEAALKRVRSLGLTMEQIERAHFSHPTLDTFMSRVVAEVLHARGLVVLSGVPTERYDDATIPQIFWGLGRYFGTPVSQSVLGDRIGHVLDASAEDPNVRGYRHQYELIPHTDYQDVVAFLCLHPGQVGGMSWFASAPAIYNQLLATRPDLLEVLCRGFYTHRFGEHSPSEAPVTEYRVPVFSTCEGYVSCRFIPRFIELAAHEGDGFTASEREAFETFEAISIQPDIGLGIMLESGEAAIMNNYTVLHSRAAFEDGEESHAKRHLLRLWLACDDKRPVVPEIALYASEREGLGVMPRPGRIPSYDDHLTQHRENDHGRMPTGG